MGKNKHPVTEIACGGVRGRSEIISLARSHDIECQSRSWQTSPDSLAAVADTGANMSLLAGGYRGVVSDVSFDPPKGEMLLFACLPLCGRV